MMLSGIISKNRLEKLKNYPTDKPLTTAVVIFIAPFIVIFSLGVGFLLLATVLQCFGVYL